MILTSRSPLRFFDPRSIRCLVLFSIAASLLAGPSVAGERIALVIGNSGYAHVEQLPYVESDLAVMADTLRSLDFDVEAQHNLDRPGMEDRIADFGQRMDQAGKEAIGLLFYAGHGFQLEGSNYLMPVDAEIAGIGDVEAASINLDLTLAEIAFATNDHKLVILDVPPDGDIADRIGVSPGLAAIDAPVGTLVAFGALPVAGDRRPRHHGLYPLALANAMARPGLMVEEVFQQVRLNVAEATDGVQIPWESSSLISPIYLAGPPEDTADGTLVEGETPARFAAIDPRTVDLVFWTSIKDNTDPAEFVDYLNSFPDGVFRVLAERRLEQLGDTEVVATEPAYRIEPLDDRLITQMRANVRAEPSSHGVIVALIEPGQTLQVTGKVVDGDWFQVSLGEDIEAFMWAPLLDRSPPSGQVADLAATLPPSKSALLGQWHGEYQCQWDTIGFTLDISDEEALGDDGIGAVFSFFPLPGSPSLPTGSYSMSGDYDAEDGTIILKSVDWIERPLGLQSHDLAGRAEIGGDAISGRIETSGCSDFNLVRGDGREKPTVQSISTQ